jgi:hypothetical protein
MHPPSLYTANEGLVPIYVFPEMKLLDGLVMSKKEL